MSRLAEVPFWLTISENKNIGIMDKQKQTVVTVDRDRVRRLFVLALVGSKEDGIFGRKRLQKLGFLAERGGKLRPFRYHRWDHGQYSPELQETASDLVRLGLLNEIPMEVGKRYQVDNQDLTQLSLALLGAMDAELPKRLEQVVAKYRYVTEEALIDEAYKYLEGVEFGDEVLSECWPDEQLVVDTLTLPGGFETMEDLFLATEPSFVHASGELIAALSRGIGPDPNQVKRVGFPAR